MQRMPKVTSITNLQCVWEFIYDKQACQTEQLDGSEEKSNFPYFYDMFHVDKIFPT